MVMELLEQGTLAERIKASQDGRIREFEVIQMAFDMLSALACMHGRRIIHRDGAFLHVMSCCSHTV